MSSYWDSSIEEHLAKAPLGFARSAYAVEVNPWVRRGEVEAAMLFRGTIVAAFGNIDTWLSELAIQASKLTDYQGRRSNLSFAFKKRMNFLREAFSSGHLLKYNRIAALFFDRLESYYDLRNICAHGKMQVLDGGSVRLMDYTPQKNGEITQRTELYQLENFGLLARRLARFSRVCQRLLNNLYGSSDLLEKTYA